jgi:hypothetical protein
VIYNNVIIDQINMREALQTTINIAAKWQNIGTLLRIPDGILSQIKHDEGRNGVNSCLREMLKVWLKDKNPPPSWSALADAVEIFDQRTAKEIRTKYCRKELINSYIVHA